MVLPSVSFVAGLILLAYLSSFVLFAFIRVVTGISIQRLGFSGLRRIAYMPKDGLKIEIRGLGLTLHRPTFAQPTWLSVVLTELKVTVDLKTLGEKPRKLLHGHTGQMNRPKRYLAISPRLRLQQGRRMHWTIMVTLKVREVELGKH
jgi:hypothetical protein